jgi:hypothetical protein
MSIVLLFMHFEPNLRFFRCVLNSKSCSCRARCFHLVNLVNELEEFAPEALSLPSFHKGLRVPDEDESVSCTGDEDVKALRGVHETDVAGVIRPHQTSNDNIALLALVVIYSNNVSCQR